jgi:hypothetical protein
MKNEPRTQNLPCAQDGLSRREVEAVLRLEAGRNEITLRHRVANVWILLFVLNTLVVMTIIFLVGFRLMTLPMPVTLALIAETVAYAGAMVCTVTRHLFPVSSRHLLSGTETVSR